MKNESSTTNKRLGPLTHLKVIDIATIIAGPLSAGLLADFGADVLKVELPKKGDGLRNLRPIKDGVSLWSKVINRNKRGITLDLRQPGGKDLFLKLVEEADVVIENFRPGTLEKWGLSPEVLHKYNPSLTILRVSAFGQEGPYAAKPGFARIADAMSGFLSLCGEKDGPPLHPGYPIADSVTGLFGVVGVLMALVEKGQNHGAPGQVVCVSLFESMFRIMDFMPIEYDQLGCIRERSGNQNPYAAPGNCFLSKDGHWCTLAASTQSIFERLMIAIDHPHLINDHRFIKNKERLENSKFLDQIISKWFSVRDADSACFDLESHGVSCARVRTMEDIFSDPHVEQTDMLISLKDKELGTVRMQGITPRFSRTPGEIRHPGPEMGQDNDRVFRDEMNLDNETINQLSEKGAI
ncbi:CoA transferase [Cocleimonas sp. KMM 6892]|uniref:CaiB/BaiF CoA transferase family protein n=1 Tax=unclassified Cocleimonas TaxID=2639732 RepID=UPI002DC04DC3|nr:MULTISPECIES: CoA transferase [unclassified Cocleimonas]MEB8433269.1 CoA transferase [Cocleimonas sp. KMM 6892]MEC4715750.1 CoA transferase [Cocleimonas sp. KMM 6895]MEC4745211.1 CoA transferase [Cocleimonas sp. KMM 6896]